MKNNAKIFKMDNEKKNKRTKVLQLGSVSIVENRRSVRFFYEK